jgi:hypothetical protein
MVAAVVGAAVIAAIAVAFATNFIRIERHEDFGLEGNKPRIQLSFENVTMKRGETKEIVGLITAQGISSLPRYVNATLAVYGQLPDQTTPSPEESDGKSKDLRGEFFDLKTAGFSASTRTEPFRISSDYGGQNGLPLGEEVMLTAGQNVTEGDYRFVGVIYAETPDYQYLGYAGFNVTITG